MKKKVVLGCLIPVILTFGGCVALLASSDAPINPTTQIAPSKAESVPLATMESVRNDRAVQVDRIELVDELSTGNPYIDPVSAGQGKLAVVYTQVQNSGKESGSLIFTTFELVDNADRKYAEISDFEEIVSVGMWAEAQGLSSADKQLFPGETASTAQVFRVAPDAAGLKVVVNGKTFETE